MNKMKKNKKRRKRKIQYYEDTETEREKKYIMKLENIKGQTKVKRRRLGRKRMGGRENGKHRRRGKGYKEETNKG